MTIEQDLIQRTKLFSLRVIKLTDALPRTSVGRTIGNQLLRSGTSVGANYRAACRARSKADFVSKLGIVEEEADECMYWLELIIEASLIPETRVQPLLREANELLSITIASRKTSAIRKSKIKNQKSPATQ